MREKLIELLVDLDCNAEYCKDCEFCEDVDGCVRRQKEIIADRLIANGVTIQEWISVSERLPKHFGTFVVAIRNPNGERLGVDSADFDPFKKYWYPSMCWDKGYKVTHWMPLPEPPKGE